MAAVERFAALAGSSASRWSRALGVAIPLELVLAVMQQENPAADTTIATPEPNGQISRGLMQVSDATALELGYDDPTQLHVPAIGIDAGVEYLGRQLARYQGSVPKAVAAYNAGSVRYTPRETFINQSYVDKVLGYFATFRSRAASFAVPVLAAIAVLLGGFALYHAAQRRGRRLAA